MRPAAGTEPWDVPATIGRSAPHGGLVDALVEDSPYLDNVGRICPPHDVRSRSPASTASCCNAATDPHAVRRGAPVAVQLPYGARPSLVQAVNVLR